MLLLSRKKKEKIVICGQVTFTVVHYNERLAIVQVDGAESIARKLNRGRITRQPFALNLEEEILVDGSVSIKYLGVQCGSARFGFTAPRAIPIVREEVLLRQEAAAVSA